MVSVTGVGRWTVAVEPDGVTTVTVDSDNGTVSVVVPPFEVSIEEITGELYEATVETSPYELV